jgi:hypothetical protein
MSVLAFLLAAAEGAEHTSKTAFYIAGGALAVWAVVISLIGMSRPGFSAKAARATMLLTVVLVAGAMSTAVLTS